MHLLVVLLLCGAADTPAPIQEPEPVDEIMVLGPVRDMTALIGASPAVHEPLILMVGWFAGDGMPYESYPLPMPHVQAHGVGGVLAFSLIGLRIETEVWERLNGRGRSAIFDLRLPFFRLGPVAVDLAGHGAIAMSGDALYQGPTDITLGMYRKSKLFTGGLAFRLGAARQPTFAVSVLTGTSRVEQTPELWFNNDLVKQSKTLSQKASSQVIAVRAFGTWKISQRTTLAGSVRRINWFRRESLLLPHTAIDAHAGIRIAIRRWCGIGLAVRWSSDHRAPIVYRSSLFLGLLIQR